MDYYKLRVDTVAVSLQDVVNVVGKYSTGYMYSREGEETNPHLHFYIETTTKEATIRSNLRKLGLSGNGAYSLKSLDSRYPLEYIAYMIKEGDYRCKNIPDSVIEEAKAFNLKVVEEMKEKKKSKKTQLQCVEEFAKGLGKDLEKFTLSTWVYCVLDYYKQSGMLVREFQIIAISETLFLKYSPEGLIRLDAMIREKMKL